MTKTISIALVLMLLTISCATVPITGRKGLNLIPSSSINSLSFQQYSDFLSANKLSTDQEKTVMVKRVGTNIQQAVEKYFSDNNMTGYLDGYEWEFNLVEDSQINAWCMPGGKVVVYTGILPVTKNETGLAVVLGHEIAHAVANHGNERMSQGLLVNFGGMALSKALESKPEETQQLAQMAFGIGANVGVLLPYSRLHESEADHLGLIFMAMAGYDPREAVTFWERMAADNSGSTPELLRTHPSDEKRIEDIKKIMPEAMEYYNKR
nr:M48 family metallopeptidase [candidate division Zixibacteria bacterium]